MSRHNTHRSNPPQSKHIHDRQFKLLSRGASEKEMQKSLQSKSWDSKALGGLLRSLDSPLGDVGVLTTYSAVDEVLGFAVL